MRIERENERLFEYLEEEEDRRKRKRADDRKEEQKNGERRGRKPRTGETAGIVVIRR